MRPGIAGTWKPAALDAEDLAIALDRAASDLKGMRIYERLADGALAFVDKKSGDVEHLVWRKPVGGLLCICPASDHESITACSAMAFVALHDIGYTPRPSKET